MTFEKQLAESKAYLKEQGLDGGYEERNGAVEKLARVFYEKTGLGVNGEFELVDEMDWEIAEEQLKKTKGWAVWQGEEVEQIWKDGKKIGEMLTSCRGSMYRAEMTVGKDVWEASNMSGYENGIWKEGGWF